MVKIVKLDIVLVFIFSYILGYSYYIFSDNTYIHARAIDSFSMVISNNSNFSKANYVNIGLHNYLEKSIQEGGYKDRRLRDSALKINLKQFDVIENYKNSADLLKDGERGLYYFIKAVWHLTNITNIDIVIKVLILFFSLNYVALYLLAKKVNLTKSFPVILLIIFSLYTPSYDYLIHMKNHWFVLPATIFTAYFSSLIYQRKDLFLYLIYIILFLILLSVIRTSVKFLLLVPILAVFLNQSIDRIKKLKFIIFSVILSLLLLLSSNYVTKTSGHSIWFPVFVGMGEAKSGFIPYPDDGYALGYDKNLQVRSDEWNQALKNQVVEWYITQPKKVVDIYKYRLEKILNPEKIFLSKWGISFTKLMRNINNLTPVYYFIIAIIFFGIFLFFVKRKVNLSPFLYLVISSIMSFMTGLLIMVKSHSYYFAFDIVYVFLISIFISMIIQAPCLLYKKINHFYHGRK